MLYTLNLEHKDGKIWRGSLYGRRGLAKSGIRKEAESGPIVAP
jgi:hypothetical protein